MWMLFGFCLVKDGLGTRMGCAHRCWWEGESLILIGTVPAEDIRTIVAICSPSLTLSLGDTVTSVLCVIYESRLKGCTASPFCRGKCEPQEVSVVAEALPFHPENTDSVLLVHSNPGTVTNLPSEGRDTSVSGLLCWPSSKQLFGGMVVTCFAPEVS